MRSKLERSLVVSYCEVLPVQHELHPARRGQVQTQVSELIAVVQLCKVLCGGWPDSTSSAEPAAGR